MQIRLERSVSTKRKGRKLQLKSFSRLEFVIKVIGINNNKKMCSNKSE